MGFRSGTLGAFQTKPAKDEGCWKTARQVGKRRAQPRVGCLALPAHRSAFPLCSGMTFLAVGPGDPLQSIHVKAAFYKRRMWLMAIPRQDLRPQGLRTWTKKPPKRRQLPSVSCIHLTFSVYLYNSVLHMAASQWPLASAPTFPGRLNHAFVAPWACQPALARSQHPNSRKRI